MASKTKPNDDDRETIRFRGRDYSVLKRFSIRRRTYLAVEHVGRTDRSRFKVIDPHAGPGGDLRSLLVTPATSSAKQHLRILKPLSNGNDNLPLILDYQVQDGLMHVVSTWVSGPDLEAYLLGVIDGTTKRPSLTECFRLFRGLAHGLSHLHRRHAIVHGDIKPANLILASGSSRLVMIDYGSSWTAESTVSRSSGDGVTVAYAAPELQCREPFVDFRSDQFSATVLLYELLTLNRPYDGLGGQAGRPEFADRMKGKLKSATKSHPDRSQVPRALCSDIDALVKKSLSFDPNDRFDSPDSWLRAINTIFSQLTPQSRLSPTNARLTRVVAWVASLFGRKP